MLLPQEACVEDSGAASTHVDDVKSSEHNVVSVTALSTSSDGTALSVDMGGSPPRSIAPW